MRLHIVTLPLKYWREIFNLRRFDYQVKSSCGSPGQILGYSFAGLGLVFLVAGFVKTFFNAKSIFISEEALEKYLEDKVGEDEIVAIDNPDKKEVMVFYRVWTGSQFAFMPYPVPYEQDPAKTLQEWGATHGHHPTHNTFIEADLLHRRLQGSVPLPVIRQLI